MAVSGEDPAIRTAPRARFGSDLKPRVAAAVAMASLALAAAWIGGIIFAVFWWLASIAVLTFVTIRRPQLPIVVCPYN